jgi:hypothetical protein
MKVGDGNNSPDPSDLLERMREAYRQEETRPVDQTSSTDQSHSIDRTSAPDHTSSAQASAPVDGLEQRLLTTAANALDGAYQSTDEVRSAVVEAIVTERYAETLGPEQTQDISRTLELTLSNDPVFQNEVDQMLMHAARDLARSAD